jgi:hypothetical protein
MSALIVQKKIIWSDTLRSAFAACSNNSTIGDPRSRCDRVFGSRSESNWDRNSIRRIVQVSISDHASGLNTFICAAESTRETERPAEIAGGTPLLTQSVSMQI